MQNDIGNSIAPFLGDGALNSCTSTYLTFPARWMP